MFQWNTWGWLGKGAFKVLGVSELPILSHSSRLAESRVKAVKTTLGHMMNSTLIGTKTTLSYAELCTTLARAASIINDRPIGVRSMTEEEIMPLTVNQLLLGRSTNTSRAYAETAQENYMAANDYQEELWARSRTRPTCWSGSHPSS